MIHQKLIICGLIFITFLCTGCSDDYNENEIISKEISADEKADLSTTKKLKPPKTKKEMDETFGIVDEQGNWTPPEGSYIEPQTGNVLNKDGVLVGITPKPYSKARPGSQG